MVFKARSLDEMSRRECVERSRGQGRRSPPELVQIDGEGEVHRESHS